MAFFKQSFETGTSGSNITTISSGGTGVNAYSQVSVGTGSTFTFDNARAAHGTLSAKVVPASGVSTLGLWTITATAFAYRGYFYVTANAVDDLYLVYVTGASGIGRVLSLHLDGNGKIVIRDRDTGAQYTSGASVPLNAWFRLELYAVVGNTTTNGVIKFGMYTGDSTTPLETVYNVSNANLNATGFDQLQHGKCNTSTYATAFWMDDELVSTTATDLLGPYVANLPPTVSAGADATVVKNTTATLTATASDPDGTISSYAWSFDSIPSGASTPSLTGGSTASATFTPTVAGVYVARITVTDNGGATASATQRVLVPSTSLRPTSTTSNPGGFTVVGAGTGAAALADELDSTYIVSGSAPANAAITFALDGVLESGIPTVKVRADIDTAVAGTVKVELLEGTTVRATQTFSVTTSIQEFSLVLTSTESSSITDRSNLFVRITANQT